MDHIINKLTERLAEATSRRGFMRTLGKVVVGGASIVAGLAIRTGNASASTVQPASRSIPANGCPLQCCTGTPCASCTCPSNTYVNYVWYCCLSNPCPNYALQCHDCYNNSNNQYNCTYVTNTLHTGCPC